MPTWLENLRLQNIFGPPQMGNDLPSQGGITGRMPIPPDMGGMGGLGDLLKQMPMPGMPPPQQQPAMPPGMPPMPPPMQGPQQGGMPPMGGGGGRTPMDVMAEMAKLYQPETEASDRYNELISQYPQRQRPGWLRVIGATLADMYGRGPAAGQEVIEGNFNRQQEDWKNQIGPAQQAANLERYNNANERQMAHQTLSNQLRAEADNERARNNEVKAGISQQRADIYAFKAKNPNLRIIIPKGGNVQTLNPQTGETQDTGIPTGSLTEMDKITLTQENAIERIRETGGEQRATEEVRQGGRQDIAETRGWTIFNVPDGQGGQKAVQINQITGEVRDVMAPSRGSGAPSTPMPGVQRPSGAGGAGSSPSATQIKVDQYNKARELFNTDTELRKFIRLKGQNEFEVTPPGQHWYGQSGPTKEQFDRIQQIIFGSGAPGIQQPGRTGMPTPGSGPQTQYKTQTNQRTGAKRTMVSTDGGVTWKVQP